MPTVGHFKPHTGASLRPTLPNVADVANVGGTNFPVMCYPCAKDLPGRNGKVRDYKELGGIGCADGMAQALPLQVFLTY